MSSIQIVIPEGLSFSALRLARDPATGSIDFDWAPIEAICDASGLDVSVFRDHDEDRVAGLLSHWYMAHRKAGGAPDLVMDELIGESEIEDSHGHGFSYPPGKA